MYITGKRSEENKKAILFDSMLYLLCLLFFFVTYFLFLRYKGIDPIYENVDDFFLKLLSSGEMTGESEVHLRYISIISGCFLRILYRINSEKTWYGIWLIACLYVSYSAVIWAILKECFKREKKIILTVVSVLLFWLQYIAFWSYSTYFVQYTTVTIIVAAAALVLYLTNHPFASTLLFFLAMTIRINAAIMMLPFLIIFWGILFLFDKEKRKETTGNLICIGAVAVLVLLIEALANRGVWQDHIKYDQARQTIVDYSAYPNYDDNIDIYSNYDISYEAYKLASERDILLLDEGFNKNSMEALAATTSRHDASRGVGVIIKDFIERSLFDYIDRPFNLIVYVLYFFAFISALILKNRKAVGLILGCVAARMTIWAYLLFINRAPTRITIGLYIAENLILLAIILKEELFVYSKKTFTIFASVLLFIVVSGVSIKWGIPHMNRYTRYVYDRSFFNESYRELREYFYDNGNKFYLLDTDSFRYFVEPVIGNNMPTKNNYVYMGCWPGNTPWTEKLAIKKGIYSYEQQVLSDKNTLFVFMNTEATGYEPIHEYYSAKYGYVDFVERDRITTKNGLEFIIVGVE